jgi:hypothetical protein
VYRADNNNLACAATHYNRCPNDNRCTYNDQARNNHGASNFRTSNHNAHHDYTACKCSNNNFGATPTLDHDCRHGSGATGASADRPRRWVRAAAKHR